MDWWPWLPGFMGPLCVAGRSLRAAGRLQIWDFLKTWSLKAEALWLPSPLLCLFFSLKTWAQRGVLHCNASKNQHQNAVLDCWAFTTFPFDRGFINLSQRETGVFPHLLLQATWSHFIRHLGDFQHLTEFSYVFSYIFTYRLRAWPICHHSHPLGKCTSNSFTQWALSSFKKFSFRCFRAYLF